MRRNLIKRVQNENGASLVFVLMVMLVVMIFSATAMMIFSSNLNQAKHQQDRLEAYYLSYSGIEMAFEALLADKMDQTKKILSQPNGYVLETKDIEIGKGKIDIKASKSSDPGTEGWIKITSIAVLTRNDLTFSRTMYFDPDNPNDTFWLND